MQPLNRPSGLMSLEDLQTLLDPIYAGISHTHSIANVTGLQTALDAKAADSAVVKLTGNQTVAGDKSFSGLTTITAPTTPNADVVQQFSLHDGTVQRFVLAHDTSRTLFLMRSPNGTQTAGFAQSNGGFVGSSPTGFGLYFSSGNSGFLQSATGFEVLSNQSTFYVRGGLDATKLLVQASAGQTASIQVWGDSVGATLASVGPDGSATLGSFLKVGPKTFATLPSASANAGAVYRLTDRTQKHCYSDGTNWLWVHDNSTVS